MEVQRGDDEVQQFGHGRWGLAAVAGPVEQLLELRGALDQDHRRAPIRLGWDVGDRYAQHEYAERAGQAAGNGDGVGVQVAAQGTGVGQRGGAGRAGGDDVLEYERDAAPAPVDGGLVNAGPLGDHGQGQIVDGPLPQQVDDRPVHLLADAFGPAPRTPHGLRLAHHANQLNAKIFATVRPGPCRLLARIACSSGLVCTGGGDTIRGQDITNCLLGGGHGRG